MSPPAKYAIIIDSGSSGSRAIVYEYISDPKNDPSGLPKIKQILRKKTKPGLSAFGKKKEGTYDIWDDHFEELVDKAKKVIPSNMHGSTPIYVQATAGMRLLPTKDRDRVLKETCEVLAHKSEFIVEPCNEHVEVIDGDTEGLYGWLALNYLTDRLVSSSEADPEIKQRHPYGFMDMGGASTQLAFVPSRKDQLDKHSDDMYSVSLKSNNGELNSWSVFVSSWLGFGANEARRRQLDALVNALPENVDYDRDGDGKGDLVDPCSPVGMKTEVDYNGKMFTVTGSGEYEGCLKTIYPLLLKHLPCSDEPCLFNGVHAPSMDFSMEKFVGVSEYWYTANDVFKLTGEYNYEDFEAATKEFCSTDWDTIFNKFENEEYGNALTLDLLQTSCFKASWIVNVLHEGFGIPRLGMDKVSQVSEKDEPVFKSVNDIDGNELSWTLGKMVLYASSQNSGEGSVGIWPGSAVAEKIDKTKSHRPNDGEPLADIKSSFTPFITLGIFLLVGCTVYYIIVSKFGSVKKLMKKVHGPDKLDSTEDLFDLEEGRGLSRMIGSNNADGRLRTRSTMNLHELSNLNGSNSSADSLETSGPHETLKHSLTFANFRDAAIISKANQFTAGTFKLGNGSQNSFKRVSTL